MQISKEELYNIKNDIFEKNASDEEKENIINTINDEINKILDEFDSKDEPIDE